MITNFMLVIAFFAVAAGTLLGYVIRQKIAKKQADSAEADAEKILLDAKTKAQEIVLQAKEKATEALVDVEKNAKEEKREINEEKKRLEKREEMMDKRFDDLENVKKKLEEKANKVKEARDEVVELRKKQIDRLEKIADLTKEQAKKALLQLTEEHSREELAARIATLQRKNDEELEKMSRNIMTQVIQKYSRSHAAEIMTSTLVIPNEEVKGKIIGREGRNIRSFEKNTGVELIVDETPESIIISSFDPVRREIAKIALEKLIDDGRIHPAKIEVIVVWAE